MTKQFMILVGGNTIEKLCEVIETFWTYFSLRSFWSGYFMVADAQGANLLKIAIGNASMPTMRMHLCEWFAEEGLIFIQQQFPRSGSRFTYMSPWGSGLENPDIGGAIMAENGYSVAISGCSPKHAHAILVCLAGALGWFSPEMFSDIVSKTSNQNLKDLAGYISERQKA